MKFQRILECLQDQYMLISKQEYNILLKECRARVARHCVIRGNFTKTNGTPFTKMFLMRKMLFNLDFTEKASLCLLFLMQQRLGHLNVQLTGLETGSTPLVLGMAQAARSKGFDINPFSVRKKRKRYGTRHIIEGIPNHLPIVVLDDIINTGRSANKCKRTLRQEGLINISPLEVSLIVSKRATKQSLFLFKFSEFN